MMYRLVSALLVLSDWLLGRGVHVCTYLPDWLEPDDYRCICGGRPNRHGTAALMSDLEHTEP